MYGFKKKAQRLADGGMVNVQKPAERPKEVKNPEYVNPFNPRDTLDRREREAGLAEGGMIRGKGTGTSDSIKAKMPEGTYVMPADTTKQLGLGKPVDVRVSNGEYALPPKAVHAIGAQVLDTIKGATHEPAGFTPRRMYLADGGLLGGLFGGEPKKVTPEQQAAAQKAMEERRAKQEQPQGGVGGYAGMYAMQRREKEAGLKNGGMVKGYKDGGLTEDDARVKAGRASVSDTVNVLNQSGIDTKNALAAGNYGGAVGSVARGALAAVPAMAVDAYKGAVEPVLAPWVRAAVNAGKGFLGDTGNPQSPQSGQSTPPATPVAAPQIPGQPNPNPTSVEPKGFKPGSLNNLPQAETNAAIDSQFKNTPYADSEYAASTTGDPRDRIMEYRGKNGERAFTNMSPEARNQGGNLSVVDMSGAREAQKFLADQSAQQQAAQQVAPQNQVITIGENGGFGFDKKDPAQARTEAIQRRVDDLRRAAGISAPTPKMIEAAIAEYGAYDSVANNVLTNQTAANRTAADSANNTADRQSRDNQYGVQNLLAARQDARAGEQAGLTNQNLGFEVGAKARLDKAQSDVLNAKTPAEQKAAQDRLYALMGKSNSDKYMSVSAGTAIDKDGNTINLPGRVFNASEGKYMDGGGQQGQQPQMTREQMLADLEANAKNMTAQEQRARVAQIRAMKE